MIREKMTRKKNAGSLTAIRCPNCGKLMSMVSVRASGYEEHKCRFCHVEVGIDLGSKEGLVLSQN